MAFPSSLPSYAGFTSSETLQTAGHAGQHNSEQTDILGIATKLGTGASTPTSTSVLIGNGAGTSTWGLVNLTNQVSGVLPTGNGGTGTASTTGTGSVVYSNSPTLASPTITNPTESGGTYNTATLNSPTIATPSITYNSNSIPNTAIQNNSITTSQLATSGLSLPNITLNPYKFSVYRTAATTSTTSLSNCLLFDTKLYDTGSNVDVVTNKGRFTAPISGFYHFSANAGNSVAGSTAMFTALYKNGTTVLKQTGFNTATAGGTIIGVHGDVQLAANDYVEVWFQGGGGSTIATGQQYCYFDGFLVSAT